MTSLPVAPLAPAAADRRRQILLGAVLVLAVWIAGSPDLNAPWILGDEFIFVVNDPDVNPANERSPRPLANRVASIWTRIHDDLYQPVPLTTYALQWELAGGNASDFRVADLLLHACNALLVWGVLHALLRRCPRAADVPLEALTWVLALLWALHPALVGAYASDMGRTHLLAALFILLSLRSYLRALDTGRQRWFALAVLLLLLANLSKVTAGWALVVLVLEAFSRGWRAALRSPRVYVVLALSAGFAGLTLYTSWGSGLAQEASEGLFGDPVARSLLAVWYYFRALLLPLWTAWWHLPVPATGWLYPPVWGGGLLATFSVALAVRAWHMPGTRLVTLGWSWWWGVLLPVLGLIGAREAVAIDRYLYQPAIGFALVLGALLVPVWAARPRTVRPMVWAFIAISAVMLLVDLPLAATNRSVIARARRVVDLNPGDPRALEGLAAAYDFARNHPLPPQDLDRIPPETPQEDFYAAAWLQTLQAAAAVPDLASYFPRATDRGPFHWRLSYRLLRAGAPELSLAQAQQAHALLPDHYITWMRLAQAWRALGDFAAAAQAYAECESRLPDDPQLRAVHYTDYADLLLFDLERDAEACQRFRAALQTGAAPPLAYTGWALCEIRHGTGEDGFRLISRVLHADPTNLRAALVLAEYHLRSHNWEQAYQVYTALLRDDPTNYAALRGFHEVALQIGRMDEATRAWGAAVSVAPDSREFRSYLVWSLALDNAETASRAAQELLARDPENPIAHFALMLVALRNNDLDAALEHVSRGLAGPPIPHARAAERAAAALRLLRERGELTSLARVPEALLYAQWGADGASRAKELLDEFAADPLAVEHAEALRRARTAISDVGQQR